MAIIHRKKHSFEECLSLLNKCLQIRGDCKSVKRNGLANAHVETQLARTLLDKDDADASIEYFSRSLRTYLKFFGKDSLDVAETLFCMGRAFSLKKRFQKSLLCYDKSMRIYEFKEPLAPKEKLGDLHREIGRDMMLNGGDLYDVLEHYRSSVSFLEVCNDASGVNDKLIRFYSEMLSIMRDVFDSEENELAQAELTDEIGDVLHRMGNLYASSGEHNKG
jgi:tetratricopeptide (TPR) repeat protein